MADTFNPSGFKVEIYIDDDNIYEAYSDKSGGRLKSLSIRESESSNINNILGNVTSNSCIVEIEDISGDLNIDNNKSININDNKVVIKKDSKVVGTFYVDTWTNRPYSDNVNMCTISCYDRLSSLGNMDMPDFDYINVGTIGDLIARLFKALGLSESDYYIDAGLKNKLSNLNTISRGTKVSDTLNEIANALLARITCNRNGIIVIKPYNAVTGSTRTVDVDNSVEDISIANNSDIKNYTAVKVKYVNLALEDEPRLLVSSDKLTWTTKDVKVVQLEIPSNVQTIDCVQIDTDTDYESMLKLQVNSYKKIDSGISIETENLTNSKVTGRIDVKGRYILSANAYVNAGDSSKGNTYVVENIYIQNEDDANNFAAGLLEYIKTMQKTCSIRGYFDVDIESGSQLIIKSSVKSLAGTYYISGVNYYYGNGYNANLSAIKVG